jgi:hypothetical protein
MQYCRRVDNADTLLYKHWWIPPIVIGMRENVTLAVIILHLELLLPALETGETKHSTKVNRE